MIRPRKASPWSEDGHPERTKSRVAEGAEGLPLAVLSDNSLAVLSDAPVRQFRHLKLLY